MSGRLIFFGRRGQRSVVLSRKWLLAALPRGDIQDGRPGSGSSSFRLSNPTQLQGCHAIDGDPRQTSIQIAKTTIENLHALCDKRYKR